MKTRYRWAGVLVGMWMAMGGMAHSLSIETLPVGEKNTLWFLQEKSIPMLAFQLSFPWGSAHDAAGKEGLADLLAATLDEGAGPYDSVAFQKRLEAAHLKLSFKANEDDFQANLVCLQEKCAEGFELLTLAMTAPRFDEEAVERMKKALLTSLSAAKGDPDTQADEGFKKAFYGETHPYARSLDAQITGLQSLKKEDLQGMMGRFSQEKVRISAAGAFTGSEVLSFMTPLFQKLPVRSAQELPKIEGQKPFAGGKRAVIPMETPQTSFVFGLPGMNREDPDFMAAYLLNHILGGGGFSSILTKVIREEKGLTYGISTALLYGAYGNVWQGEVAVRNEKAKEALALLEEQLQKIVKDGVTPLQLQEAKQYLLGSYPLRLDGNLKIVQWMTGLQRDNLGPDYLEKREKLIEAVTAADIQRVAQRLFQNKSLVIVGAGGAAL